MNLCMKTLLSLCYFLEVISALQCQLNEVFLCGDSCIEYLTPCICGNQTIIPWYREETCCVESGGCFKEQGILQSKSKQSLHI